MDQNTTNQTQNTSTKRKKKKEEKLYIIIDYKNYIVLTTDNNFNFISWRNIHSFCFDKT